MRRVLCALSVFGLATTLFAASPFEGTWKLNSAKSKYTKGAVPKEETIVIASQGDQFQITITGTDGSGSPIALKYTVPASGGAGKVTDGPYDGVSWKVTDANTRDVTYLKGGKDIRTTHAIVSKDGKSMKAATKGLDAQGKPVAGTMVFDK